MPSRPFPESPSPSKTRVLFLLFTISSSVVILFSALYFLYHLWFSLLAHRSRTIPLDSPAPLKLQRFTYRDLKIASAGFDGANIIGKGGSGTVFRGVLEDGKLIAIKRLYVLSLKTEGEFQNELHVLGGLRSPFVVPLLGYCAYKSKRIFVYEYVSNGSLQEHLFADEVLNLSWDRRFSIILDVARALEFLHLGCDPPVVHGDLKPANVLLDSEFRARISDFGLARMKAEDELGVDLFSQELSGTLAPAVATPEVDFALALQASSSSKNSPTCYSVTTFNYNANIAYIGSEIDGKEKEVWSLDGNKFAPLKDELGSIEIDHNKELSISEEVTQWGEDWWWRQDEGGELCSKHYVKEWIGSQISPPTDPDWDEGNKNQNPEKEVKSRASKGKKKRKKKHRKMQEWWKEERLAEKKWKKGFKMPRFDRGLLRRKKKFVEYDCDTNGDFSFRKGWKKRDNHSFGSDMLSGDQFSRELSSTTSMRGTLCYVAPEYGGCGYRGGSRNLF